MLNIDLTDTTTLVIGGSRGIGASIVEKVAEAGGNVAWTFSGSDAGRAASEELAAHVQVLTGDGFFHAADCTDETTARDVVDEAVERWGALHHLVYNAGFTSPVGLLDLTAEEWRRVVDLNLTGAFLSIRPALEQMQRQGRGVIVLIGSAAVATGGGGRADYISAKAGLEGLSRAITKEFAPKGIRCNVVHPSLIDTDLLRTRYPDAADREKAGAGVPVGRLGKPEDISCLTVFLLSDMASYITGQSIWVDGGRTFYR